MGKSTPQAPAVASPQDISSAQTTSNLQTAEGQAALNNVNQVTPYGSVNYDITGNQNGVPTYTQTTNLSPLGQGLLNQENTLASTGLSGAQQLASGINYSPINTNTADSATLNSSPQLLDQQATDATYNQQKGFLDPQWNESQKQLTDQLSRQGIPVGSDAYNNAMTNFNNTKTQAYQSAQDSAVNQGLAGATDLNNIALQDQNQNVNQQIQAQNQPVSLLTALMGGTSNNNLTSAPTSSAAQTSISPTNVVGAYQTSNNAAQQAYQNQVSQQNALWGGLGSIGSSLLAFL